MAQNFTIAVFEGDGIGPEIMGPTVALLNQLSAVSSAYTFTFDMLPAGAAHYAKTGESLPAKSLSRAQVADARSDRE